MTKNKVLKLWCDILEKKKCDIRNFEKKKMDWNSKDKEAFWEDSLNPFVVISEEKKAEVQEELRQAAWVDRVMTDTEIQLVEVCLERMEERWDALGDVMRMVLGNKGEKLRLGMAKLKELQFSTGQLEKLMDSYLNK